MCYFRNNIFPSRINAKNFLITPLTVTLFEPQFFFFTDFNSFFIASFLLTITWYVPPSKMGGGGVDSNLEKDLLGRVTKF